jgi:hypothetical protein
MVYTINAEWDIASNFEKKKNKTKGHKEESNKHTVER